MTLAASLPVLDQNPLLAGFTLPGSLPSAVPSDSQWTVDTTFSWGSTALVQSNERETLTVDAETRDVRVGFTRGLAHGYAIRADVPWRQTTGGSLDSFIDDWHDAFGLPEGARPLLPRDRLTIDYRRDGAAVMRSRTSSSGLGDLSFHLGKQWFATERSHTTAWIGLKLPTGDADEFRGSGSVDVSALVASEYRFGSGFTVFGHVGGAWLDDGDRLQAEQRNWNASAMFGISAQVLEAVTLTAQFDAHTAIYPGSELDAFDAAGILTVGGTIDLGDYELALGVSEDIVVESSPDVVFVIGIKARFGAD